MFSVCSRSKKFSVKDVCGAWYRGRYVCVLVVIGVSEVCVCVLVVENRGMWIVTVKYMSSDYEGS